MAILYDQVFVVKQAQPILIFLVIFLFGCIPFLRGDRKQEGEFGPFVRIVMALLGVKLPANFKEAEDEPESEEESPRHGQGGSRSGGRKPPPGSTSV